MDLVGDAVGAEWPDGKTAAISLTFDGGLPEHYELVAPLLEEHGVCGTFFVTMPQLLENPEAWRKVAARGHEIGSHSFAEISDGGRLTSWTLDMVREDLLMTDRGIVDIIGQPVISFAKPGIHTETSDGDYAFLLQRQFSFLRSPRPGPNPIDEVDLTDVSASHWAELVGPIETLIPPERHWSVVVFEEFFGPDVAAAEDDLLVLLGHLERRQEVWASPFGKVGGALSKFRRMNLA